MSWSLVLLALLGLAPSPAGGVPDPREVRPHPLDVAAATATRRGPAIVFTIETYAPFTNADLQQADGEDYAVAITVGTDRDEAFERLCYVHVRPDAADGEGLGPYGVCTKDERVPEADPNAFSPRERFAGFAIVTRPSGDSVEVTIPAPRGLGRFRWQARMVSSPTSGSVYYDYVPDGGPARGRGQAGIPFPAGRYSG